MTGGSEIGVGYMTQLYLRANVLFLEIRRFIRLGVYDSLHTCRYFSLKKFDRYLKTFPQAGKP